MEFHYYYIIQDIIGVLMAFIGLRMLTLSIQMARVNGQSKNALILYIKYILVILAGVNFLINTFGIKPWITSIILVIISVVITPKDKAN